MPDQRKEKGKKHRRQLLVIAGLVSLFILGIVAIPYYLTYLAPFKRTVLSIDDRTIPLKVLYDRTRATGSDPLAVLQTMTEEQVIQLCAVQFGIRVTDADIDQALRNSAAQGSDPISDAVFKEWYRQQLNNTRMSDSEYRDGVRNRLLAQRVQAYLADRVPLKREQVHLHLILVNNNEDAQKVSAKLKAGADFAAVAREFSADPNSKETGGDLGWLPPVLIMPYFQSQIAALPVNRPSEPLPFFEQTDLSAGAGSNAVKPSAYYIFMVSEKDSNRPLDEQHLQLLKDRALELWLPEEIKKHSVKYDLDSEVMDWLNRRLTKNG